MYTNNNDLSSLKKYNDELISIISNTGKLAAVKFIYDKKLGYGLREAKEYVDRLVNNNLKSELEKLKADNEVLLNALKESRLFIYNRLMLDESRTGCTQSYAEDMTKRNGLIEIIDKAIKQVDPTF